MRVVLLGNAGSGKSTMARRLTGESGIPLLPLDSIAWTESVERRPLADSVRALERFLEAHEEWVVEGCYGDLVEAALPACTELRFLNPGVETCLAHCRRRPWEPDKFATPEAQDAMLETLLAFVRSYETRDDEFGLRCHRRVFDAFDGPKREYT